MIARSVVPAGGRSPLRALQVTSTVGDLLPAQERHHLESRFRHDFAHVRVHVGQQAERSAADLNTDAYTLGNHIVFRSSGDRLRDPRGRSLLEHEALHTLQAAPQEARGVPRVASRGEEAERGASAAARGDVVQLARIATPTILRAPPPGQLDLGGSLAETADPMMARVVGSGTLDRFALGKAEITPVQRAAIGQLAGRLLTLLRRYPGSRIHVTGHTDAVGGEERNDALGLERANAVKAELIGFGINGEAIDVESKGKHELLVPSKTSEPQNRRAAIQFEPTTGPRVPQMQLPDLRSTPAPPLIDPNSPYNVPGGLTPSSPSLPPGSLKMPPAIKALPDKSPYDLLNEQIDHDLRGLKPHLPAWLYDQLKNGTHAAAKGLITKVLGGAIDVGPLPPQVKAILSKLLELLEKKPSDYTKGPDPENRGSPYNPQNWDTGPKHDLPPIPGVLQLPPIKF
jgi:outer membrane protein OmpA-like peptidoglycan-associated protein